MLHGHRVAYRLAGEGPPIVLIHGITASSASWQVVGPMLARRHAVLAPDLLGHGESAKPRGDYSMGAFASELRDLMVALGIGPATIVGHSLGGGVAMQFACQFPERAQRLALVSSGRLGLRCMDCSERQRCLAHDWRYRYSPGGPSSDHGCARIQRRDRTPLCQAA
jgi:pimeloyl-ACP methyl ester carboxylesterase